MGEKMCEYPDCKRPLHDNKHCIFHSHDIEGKKAMFDEKFWAEFEKQKTNFWVIKYNFKGFVFPGDISFFEKDFLKDIDFSGAKFKGDTNFQYATFFKDADFKNAIFSYKTNFHLAEFHGITYFKKTRFKGEVLFSEAKFNDLVDFEKAIFHSMSNFKSVLFSDNVSFSNTIFDGDTVFHFALFSKEASFYQSRFNGDANYAVSYFIGMGVFCDARFKKTVSFKNARFEHGANFKDARFRGTVNFTFSQFLGEFLDGLFDAIKNKWFAKLFKGRFKITDFRIIISDEIAKKYPVINRIVKDAWYIDDYKRNYPIIYWLWNITAKCGQSFTRWAVWSLSFALYFAGNFCLIDYAFPTAFSFNPAIQDKSFWSFIYYSVVTFTTLGFGDIIPTLAWAQGWVMAEVITGYIMLGGLISILASKLARRS